LIYRREELPIANKSIEHSSSSSIPHQNPYPLDGHEDVRNSQVRVKKPRKERLTLEKIADDTRQGKLDLLMSKLKNPTVQESEIRSFFASDTEGDLMTAAARELDLPFNLIKTTSNRNARVKVTDSIKLFINLFRQYY
jgi:hypothetical protein